MARRRARGPSLELLAIASFLLVGAAADASQVYSITGKFVSNQGRLINFPLVGDVPCPSIVIGYGIPGTGGYTPPTAANPFGCIPAKAKVTTTGKGVAGAFEMPPNAFAQPAHSSNGLPRNWLPVKYYPPVRQISTSIAFAGPALARTGQPGSMADGMNTAAFRQFRAGAWATQTGRLAARFTWCPGGCTGSKPVVKYSSGPNRFGGTMGMLMSPGSNVSKLVFQAPLGVGFVPLGAYGSRATGAGYAVKRTDPAVTGSLFAKYMTNMMPSMRITMGTTYVGPLAVPERKHYGFPLTTGIVLVRQFDEAGGTTTLTARGGDEVTPMGARNISLVAGGITIESGSLLGGGTANMTQVLLPEPGAAGLLAGVVAMLGIAASRARRQRR